MVRRLARVEPKYLHSFAAQARSTRKTFPIRCVSFARLSFRGTDALLQEDLLDILTADGLDEDGELPEIDADGAQDLDEARDPFSPWLCERLLTELS